MDKFNEIKNEYKQFQIEFSENIRDNFGVSIINEGLEPIFIHLKRLCLQENKIEVKTLNIQRVLLEARAIMPDLGA